MQFQRIHVQNWRCFTDESVRFEDGVTVLYGNNGSGKSSLLEAAFFALYGIRSSLVENPVAIC
ncbi:AAA family ATPase [Halobacterium salinarum]|uniref:AAA family ATPase n=1 Tax=Halobacterium salinarum TaxID=2242 RepID=UPI0032C24358